MNPLKNHWEKVYKKKADNEVGWFQTVPEKSIELIEKYATSNHDKIIDVGGGASNLTKLLCKIGYKNFSVLDISSEAIERCRAKLLRCKGVYELIAADILDFEATTPFKIWHDRAVFHFLTKASDIEKYASIASKSIMKNGILLLGTFSLSGPNACSGLPVSQYRPDMLEKIFSKSFSLVESCEEVHITPTGIEQDFVWVVLRHK